MCAVIPPKAMVVTYTLRFFCSADASVRVPYRIAGAECDSADRFCAGRLGFSVRTQSVAAMGALHPVFWFVATWFGLRFLNGSLKQFASKSSEGVKVWTIIFILVQLQMMTALRR